MDTITVYRVLEVAKELVAENPDAINPRVAMDMACAYVRRDDIENPANAAPNCFGGAILLRLGLGLPKEGHLVDKSPDVDRLSDNAMKLLMYMQWHADTSLVWSEALPKAVAEYNRNHEDERISL